MFDTCLAEAEDRRLIKRHERDALAEAAEDADAEGRAALSHFIQKLIETDDDGREPIAKRKETTMTAEQQLEKMAHDHAGKHGISFAKAYTAVIRTPEGSDLYTKSLEEDGSLITKADDSDSEAEAAWEELRKRQVQKAEIKKAAQAMSAATDDAYSEIAKSIRKDGESEAAAYVRAMKMRPDLYNGDVALRRNCGL